MARVFKNFDVSSLYPNIVRIFGYSSRSQKNKSKYVDTLKLRMDAKHKRLSQDVLNSLDVTNDDLKGGLKLPINAYTGALRAKFNALYDPLQGFSICTTAQQLILQLIYDLKQVPTVEIIMANTDAVGYTIEEEYQPQALQVIKDWENLTSLEMEEDNIVKMVMRDVNNYCEIVQTGDNDFKVNYKGGEFKGKHKFAWNKEEKIFEYSFDDEIEANSLTIVSEALLKKLLFDIPIEDTINNCNDIFRFQMITHLGSTYEKCVQETTLDYSTEIKQLEEEYIKLINTPYEDTAIELEQWENSEILKNKKQSILDRINYLKNNSIKDIELQRNNRIYASNGTSGTIIKVKPDGRRDSLALCPPNPIVDNKNECTIEDVNKSWYIKIANQKLNDFLGIKRLAEYKKEELLTMANDLGMVVDKKVKKDDLIKLIEERNEVKNMATKKVETNEEVKTMTIYEKIAKMTKEIREHDFVMDCANPGNLGGKEYASIGQYYNILHNLCDKYHLLFKWDVKSLECFEKDVFKPTGKMPSNVAVVRCKATFMDIDAIQYDRLNSNENICYTGDNIYSIEYTAMAGGSDIADKSVSGASTLAFRNWFDKNFTPKYMNTIEEEITESSEEKTEAPKIPTYIPTERKEEIKKEVVETKQHEESDDEDIKEVISKIMKVRELSGNDGWGKETLKALYSGEVTSADILAISLKVDTKLESLGVTE